MVFQKFTLSSANLSVLSVFYIQKLSIVSTLVALFMIIAGPSEASQNIGEKSPDFTATDSFGEPVKLSQFLGKIVVLEWTNHDCPYVGKHYGTGNMQSLQKEATEQGVIWLSVISSAPGRQGFVSGKQGNELRVQGH